PKPAHGLVDLGAYQFPRAVATPGQLAESLAVQVSRLVAQGVLNQSQGNLLAGILTAAEDSINAGNTVMACNQVASFDTQVQMYVNDGVLSLVQGRSLSYGADVLTTALGCQPSPPATLYVGPRRSDSPLRFKRIAAGEYHSLALQSNGTVVAWGSNSSGQTNVPAGLGS